MASLPMHFLKRICACTIYSRLNYSFSPCLLKRRNFSCSSSTSNIQRKFGDKHEWVTLDGKIGTVGVTHYAQNSLGEVVFIQLPEVNSQCKAEDDVGVIESVKAVNEICSPVSGTITEVNTKLEEQPSIVNESCYDDGWIFKIELSDTPEMDKLMNEKQYEEYLKSME